jgi:RNA polymerase sigma-70 factor (ECF subfamily)
MKPNCLDSLLENLSSDDPLVTEQAFRAYEPYLRMVVRRRLPPEMRTKFDSVDIVQSVWVHMIKSFREAGRRFTDARHLRAFLTQLTHHRLIDRLRRHRLAVAIEEPLDQESYEKVASQAGEQPVDVLVADELWEQMLELCPPAHHELLRLKRAGALTAEVAARTGLNEGSVRRIIQDLSKRLARKRQEADQ